MDSFAMLACWSIWNERNARVFRNKSAPPAIIFYNIKTEAKLWAIAGAKHVRDIMLGE